MPEASPKKRGFGAFLVPFRSKPFGSRANSVDSSLLEKSIGDVKRHQQNNVSYTRQRKSLPSEKRVSIVEQKKQDAVNGGHSHHVQQQDFPAIDVSQAWERDKQTGEITDHTDMLHSLVDQDPFDPLSEQAYLLAARSSTHPGERIVSVLSPD